MNIVIWNLFDSALIMQGLDFGKIVHLVFKFKKICHSLPYYREYLELIGVLTLSNLEWCYRSRLGADSRYILGCGPCKALTRLIFGLVGWIKLLYVAKGLCLCIPIIMTTVFRWNLVKNR